MVHETIIYALTSNTYKVDSKGKQSKKILSNMETTELRSEGTENEIEKDS